jgi:hypothetical protein
MNGGKKIVIYNFKNEDDDFIDGGCIDREPIKQPGKKSEQSMAGTGLGLHPSDKEFKLWTHGVIPT